MNKKLLESRGFNLVELILAVAILSIIISFMFTFFLFNYSTFLRSSVSYNKQTDLNGVIRIIEKELRFASEVSLFEKDGNNFNDNKNYFYIKDNSIIIKKANGKPKKLITDDIKIYDSEPHFKLNNNLITVDIKGKYISNDEEFNLKYSTELLNIKGNNDLEGYIIEYVEIKGDDAN